MAAARRCERRSHGGTSGSMLPVQAGVTATNWQATSSTMTPTSSTTRPVPRSVLAKASIVTPQADTPTPARIQA